MPASSADRSDLDDCDALRDSPSDLDARVAFKADGGGGSGGDAGLRPFPPQLAGTVVLLDATKGVVTDGDKVRRWEDQSGNSNHAMNGNADFQPQLVMVNGTPAVRFSGKRPKGKSNRGGSGGTLLRIRDNASVQFGPGDWLIEVVVAYRNELDGSHNGAFGTFFGKWGSNGEILFTGNWTYTETLEQACVHLGFGETAPIGIESVRGSAEKDKEHPLNDGKARLIAARRFGRNVEVRINGVSDTKETFPNDPNFSFPGKHIGIGSFSAASDTDSQRALEGDIYYLQVVKGSVSDADLSELEGALMARFETAP